MKCRKKPVIIDAVQFDGTKKSAIRIALILGIPVGVAGYNNNTEEMWIRTLEGLHTASKGDWIIKGVKGEFYPCKPDIFDMTYEQIDE